MSVRINDTASRGDYFNAHLRELLSSEGCPVCRESVDGENDYLSFLMVETYRVRKIQEEITAALGFCLKHGSWLKQRTEKSYQITFLNAALVGDILDYLRKPLRDGREEPGSRLALPDPCPACALGEHVAATKISMLSKLLQESDDAERYGHPGLLCFPHFQKSFPHLTSPLLQRLLAIQQKALERSKDSLGTIPETSTAHPSLDASSQVTGTLQAALTVAVGNERGSAAWPDLNAPDDKQGAPHSAGEFSANITRDDICPVCLEVRRAWREWITRLEAGVQENETPKDAFPACAEHVWAGVQLGGLRVAAAIARNVVDLELHRICLGQELMPAVPPNGRQRLSERLQSRLQGSHSRLAKACETLIEPVPCPVCRWMDAARDRALGLLFALLQERRHRIAFEKGYGLCVKHLSRALALRPPQATRCALIDCEAAKLASLAWELEEALHRWTWAARPEAKGTEQTAWYRALSRFSGALEATNQWPELGARASAPTAAHAPGEESRKPGA